AALLPDTFTDMGGRISHDFDHSLSENPDVVMMLRVQKERMLSNFENDEAKYIKDWSLSSQRLNLLPKSSLVMHPGPINRGLEISSEAADDPRSTILLQVANGVAVRMAVLRRVLAVDA
ncbi:MAG: aspartate carbamoyltransferase, partial [Verrucomicrobia bacterium]|nr:aspartate carbamoyltransferase [Verrucomicrobiota bacterium]